MKLSLKWLSRYVDLPADAEEVARRLTAAGHAVEGLERHGDSWVLDVDVTTNRPDCMNHLGLARELAVLFDRPLRLPAVALEESAEPAAEAIEIHIDDPDLCPRYAARVVRGVKVGPSPPWLVEALGAIGARSINNVVDVTNFVLWELGQPLHAFDLAKLGDATVRVRRARGGETLTTLDGVERRLTPEMLVIADSRRPVALAGVMGGEDSEVSAATHDVLLESAHFEPASVRRTASALDMHTDASHRFERGADPEVCARAADRAAALIAEVAGGSVLAGAVDVYPRPVPRSSIVLDHRRLCAFAGVEIEAGRIEAWLRGLGCDVAAVGDGTWKVTVPSWRQRDLERVADLYEEVVRLHGYDGIPATLPALSGADGHTSAAHRRATSLRHHLAATGFAEAINFAFHDPQGDALFPGLQPGAGLELGNPLSERYRVMRRSLLPNLIEAARFNQRRGLPAVRLFEIGHVFAAAPPAGSGDLRVSEIEALALVAGGEVGTPWDHRRQLDLFDLKGALESLARSCGLELRARPGEHPALAAGATAELWVGDVPAGYLGRLLGTEEPYPLFVAELRTDAFAGGAEAEIRVPSRFPGVSADLTLTHALEVAWSEIEAAVAEISPEHLAGFGLKDRYRGEGVPAGAVNTTITFLYSSPEGTLTQEEVNERQTALAEELERRFGWRS